jgi:hypothetical protein
MSDRDRRALTVGGLILVVAWGLLRAAPALTTYVQTLDNTLSQRVALLARADARLLDLRQLDDSIRRLEATAGALPRLLLVGDDVETATVDLMQRIRDQLNAREISFQEFGSHGVLDRQAPLVLAHVSVTIETDFRELLDIVREIEQDSTTMVERLEISAADPHEPSPMERLTATLDVSGWFRGPAEVRTGEPSPLSR